jgi:hypothetical protein
MLIKKTKTSKECDKMVTEAAVYIAKNSRKQAEEHNFQ